MTHYSSLNVRLPHSQLNELKPALKHKTKVVLRLSSNMILIILIMRLIFFINYY